MKNEIKRRRFGKTDLMVTELSFGAMNLRLLDNVEQTYEILNYVLDRGVNLIDTARAYNGKLKDGTQIESEVLVGNTIRSRKDLKEHLNKFISLLEDSNMEVRKSAIKILFNFSKDNEGRYYHTIIIYNHTIIIYYHTLYHGLTQHAILYYNMAYYTIP